MSDSSGTLKLSPDSSTVRIGLAYNFYAASSVYTFVSLLIIAVIADHFPESR